MRKKAYKILLLFVLCVCSKSVNLNAQQFVVNTNLLEWANLITMNVNAGMAVSRHWSLGLGVKYNPFYFTKGEDDFSRMQNKQLSGSIYAKYWPWHVYSGLWASTQLRYQQYNFGGVFSEKTTEGVRMGMGLSVGYTYMINSHFNIDFGVGLWAGYDDYIQYKCPVCGITIDKGNRFFLRPNDIIIAISYVF